MVQAAVTMNQLQSQLDVIGHNLANSETTGYKSRESEFSSLLFQQIDNLRHQSNATGRLTPDGIRVGSGAKLGSINNNLSIGPIKTTDRDLDVALQNENHLFQVQVNNGDQTEIQYTRDGSFYLNPVNNDQSLMLTTAEGHPVLGENGPIVVDRGIDKVDIRTNGEIYAQRGTETEYVGRLTVVEAIRPRALEAEGENMFRLPDTAELEYNLNEIIQQVNDDGNLVKSRALEHSNVDMGKQMADLILTQRSYQSNARTITMADQMSGLVNQLR